MQVLEHMNQALMPFALLLCCRRARRSTTCASERQCSLCLSCAPALLLLRTLHADYKTGRCCETHDCIHGRFPLLTRSASCILQLDRATELPQRTGTQDWDLLRRGVRQQGARSCVQQQHAAAAVSLHGRQRRLAVAAELWLWLVCCAGSSNCTAAEGLVGGRRV
jgi:hypothetical protein